MLAELALPVVMILGKNRMLVFSGSELRTKVHSLTHVFGIPIYDIPISFQL